MSKYIFNSTTFFNPKIDITNSLLQHFEGWVIKTKRPTFNCGVGTLMDFRLNQNHGATFMYVLPTSACEALIEYTLFSKETLEEEAYKAELENYIQDYLKIKDYEIIHKEAGIIPMSLAKFSRKIRAGNKIINVGTAGGFTKASSGYTFQFIQRNTQLIIDRLIKDELPNPEMTFRDKMFQWYDRTLLDVMISNKMSGKEIFSIMFKRIPPEKILAFLGNESSFLDDIKIMLSLPTAPFLTSGVRQLFGSEH
ncbi:MAG: lycopene cyclase family protein [Bacteroidota bacterium]